MVLRRANIHGRDLGGGRTREWFLCGFLTRRTRRPPARKPEGVQVRDGSRPSPWFEATLTTDFISTNKNVLSSIYSVSYTHLDVYKRQTSHKCVGFQIPFPSQYTIALSTLASAKVSDKTEPSRVTSELVRLCMCLIAGAVRLLSGRVSSDFSEVLPELPCISHGIQLPLYGTARQSPTVARYALPWINSDVEAARDPCKL